VHPLFSSTTSANKIRKERIVVVLVVHAVFSACDVVLQTGIFQEARESYFIFCISFDSVEEAKAHNRARSTPMPATTSTSTAIIEATANNLINEEAAKCGKFTLICTPKIVYVDEITTLTLTYKVNCDLAIIIQVNGDSVQLQESSNIHLQKATKKFNTTHFHVLAKRTGKCTISIVFASIPLNGDKGVRLCLQHTEIECVDKSKFLFHCLSLQ
jgi:hypothetical protein